MDRGAAWAIVHGGCRTQRVGDFSHSFSCVVQFFNSKILSIMKYNISVTILLFFLKIFIILFYFLVFFIFFITILLLKVKIHFFF